MIKSLNTWKKIIIYGIVTLLIFSLSLTLMIAYNFYVQSINANQYKNNDDKNVISSMNCDEDDKDIKFVERVDQLKIGYKVDNEKNPHIFLIDVLKIDGCKYIMVHNHIDGDTDLALIHAESCTNCKR